MNAAPNREYCVFRHDWGKFGEPIDVVGVSQSEGKAQKRTCKRCNAVHYRRVLITN